MQPEGFLCLQDFTAQEEHEPQDPSAGYGEVSVPRAMPALKAQWWPRPCQTGSTAMAQVLGLVHKAE